jgi:hypothetical protein
VWRWAAERLAFLTMVVQFMMPSDKILVRSAITC